MLRMKKKNPHVWIVLCQKVMPESHPDQTCTEQLTKRVDQAEFNLNRQQYLVLCADPKHFEIEI